jgi:hypothetical protein
VDRQAAKDADTKGNGRTSSIEMQETRQGRCSLLNSLQKSLGDPDPHGSALSWLSWICIRIEYAQIPHFVTLKSGQDPDPDPHGSAFVWLPGSGLRKKLDPDLDPHRH